MTLKNRALAILARREHSRFELKKKLNTYSKEEEKIEALLDELEKNNYLDDRRFTEHYIQIGAHRGKGPQYIEAILREKGILPVNIEAALASSEEDWVALARRVRAKKFKQPISKNRLEQAKQKRFLYYRGFSQDQIKAVFD